MNILKVHECVKIENERLVLQNRLLKIRPEHKDKESELKTEIIKLTARINILHRDIEEKK